MEILPRALTAPLEHSLDLFPVVVLTGARQTGKSTLVRHAQGLAQRRYITLDTAVNRGLATVDPHTLMQPAQAATGITIDEVQRVPQLVLAIKKDVDADRANGRYLLTGSANLLLLKSVAESLAGRARYLTLWPMTRREQLGLASCGIWGGLLAQPSTAWPDLVQSQTAPAEPWETLAARGGYPQPALLNPTTAFDASRQELFTGYTQTYLERDLRDLAAIDGLPDFQRLMRAVCLRLGAVLNQTDLARDTGLARTTLQRYLNLLEVSYQLVRLEPYSVNRTKRLVKSPKVYWSDTGLALYLSESNEVTGEHMENIIFTDLLAWREMESARPSILYWRTSAGEEVDFVIEYRGKLLGIEVKCKTNPGLNDTRGLRAFIEEYDENVLGGLLLYGGDEVFWIAKRVLAVPWWKVI
jgi:predicted AAA+ superfamily ATPase